MATMGVPLHQDHSFFGLIRGLRRAIRQARNSAFGRLMMRTLSILVLLACSLALPGCEDDPTDLDHLEDAGPGSRDGGSEADDDAGSE